MLRTAESDYRVIVNVTLERIQKSKKPEPKPLNWSEDVQEFLDECDYSRE
jgi:hypothetical protein